MPIDDVIWELEAHTKAKHEILRYYLGAWFPILASVQPRILYVDGFAGPGEYKDGEHGSPVIALEVAIGHMLAHKLKELVFLFIEKDPRRAEHLESMIDKTPLPPNFKVHVERGSFEAYTRNLLREIAERKKRLAPSFFFIDPFGVEGLPMSLMGQIAEQPSSEVLVNFSYQPLNQWFLKDETKHHILDELFGNDTWRKAMTIVDPVEKEEFLRRTYEQSLRSLGWNVRPFKMVNKHNQTQYYLIFATKNPLGMLAMKRAMWSSAPSGEFSYFDLSNPGQVRMLDGAFDDIYAKELADAVYARHKGACVSKRDLMNKDLAWDPICLERHLTKALRILENEEPPRIIDVSSRKRRGTFPDPCEIHFADK